MPNRRNVSHQAFNEPGVATAFGPLRFSSSIVLNTSCAEPGFGAIRVRPHRCRHRALTIDEAMTAVGQANMRHAAADDADHHRLDPPSA